MSGEEIRFNFAKYDVGGKGAKAGDGKLTGEEVQKAKADGWNVWDGMPKAGKENQEPPRLNTQQPLLTFKKMPPIKMPEPPFANKINDFGFDRTKEYEEQNEKKGIKPISIDWYNPEQSDSMDSLKDQISKIDGKKLMEDFQNKYGK